MYENEVDPVRRDFELAADWIGYPTYLMRGMDGDFEYGDSHTQRAWELWQICAAGVKNTDCPIGA